MISEKSWPGEQFLGRLGIQQRVLPSYRINFFDLLGSACARGLNIIAGSPLPEESITPARALKIAQLSRARNLHFFNPRSQFYLLWQSGLLDWLRKWDPEALVIEANPRYLSTNLAIRWMHARKRIVIGWGLGSESYSGVLAVILDPLRRSFLRSLDGIIAYSHKGGNQYLLEGIPEERIFIATNAVTAKPDQPPPKRTLGYEGAPKVIFVGRLQSRKYIDCLIKACAAMPKEKQPRLWIVGDGPEREILENMAREVYPQTEFKGALHSGRLSELLNAADLFVLPGTGGLAVQEAMAHALPVVVGLGDGTQEDLVRVSGDSGVGNGWLIKSGDIDSLVDVLKLALSDVERLRCMGAESYRIVSEEINIGVMVRVFIQALNNLLI